MTRDLFTLDGVGVDFGTRGGPITAVTDVSLRLGAGETLALVGESGSGKTTIGRVLAALQTPTRGRVLYRGRDIRSLKGPDRKALRLAVQMVHQDPYAALNPTQSVSSVLTTPLLRHRLAADRRDARRQAADLLDDVGLTPTGRFLDAYPHELSGGQRQRLCIARALTVRPACLVADEAVSMVDVSLRLSILDLLRRLQDERGLAILFISHDLALTRHFAPDGRLAVLYLGTVLEEGRVRDVVEKPQQPYTRALVAAVPRHPLDAAEVVAALPVGGSEIPSLLHRPDGCPFHPRCAAATDACRAMHPALLPTTEGHRVACHLVHPPVSPATSPRQGATR